MSGIKLKHDAYKRITYITTGKIKQDHLKFIRGVLIAHGKDVTRELRRVIRTGKRTGIHWLGLPNQSSAPGEPPANQYGRLARGYKSKTGRLEMMVYTNVKYAPFLENGTSKIKPRPHFIKTIGSLHNRLEANLNKFKGSN
jgi:hypothetical protein